MAIEYTRCTIFMGAGCDTDQYLLVAKVKEGLTVIKRAAQKFDVKDLILGSQVSWRLGNGIRLRSQTGLRLWRTEMIART
jgi:hypothetical protein